MQKQIVPDDGETSEEEQQHGMQEVRRHREGDGADTMWVRGKSTDYEVCVCIKMNRRRGEGVERYDSALK